MDGLFHFPNVSRSLTLLFVSCVLVRVWRNVLLEKKDRTTEGSGILQRNYVAEIEWRGKIWSRWRIQDNFFVKFSITFYFFSNVTPSFYSSRLHCQNMLRVVELKYTRNYVQFAEITSEVVNRQTRFTTELCDQIHTSLNCLTEDVYIAVKYIWITF